MKSSLNIGIVGLGNLGWNLCSALSNAGYQVRQIVTTRQSDYKDFRSSISSEIRYSISELSGPFDLIFICRSDQLIQKCIAGLEANKRLSDECLVVHTSGSTFQLNSRFVDGVFYPFQTFTAGFEANWSGTPIFTECESESKKEILDEIATKIGGIVYQLTDQQRKMLHVAGVFSSNFPNHLMRLIFDFLERNDIDTKLVQPLMIEAIRKGFALGPENAQTGPAIRKDLEVINNHLEMLESYPEMKQFYKLFTKGIQNQ